MVDWQKRIDLGRFFARFVIFKGIKPSCKATRDTMRRQHSGIRFVAMQKASAMHAFSATLGEFRFSLGVKL